MKTVRRPLSAVPHRSAFLLLRGRLSSAVVTLVSAATALALGLSHSGTGRNGYRFMCGSAAASAAGPRARILRCHTTTKHLDPDNVRPAAVSPSHLGRCGGHVLASTRPTRAVRRYGIARTAIPAQRPPPPAAAGLDDSPRWDFAGRWGRVLYWGKRLMLGSAGHADCRAAANDASQLDFKR